MKLKHIVAIMSAASVLVSYPALADDSQQTSPKKHHKKVRTHHVAKKHHRVSERTHEYRGFRDVPPAPPYEVCPAPDMYQQVMDIMNQNVGRAKPTVGCNKPLSWAGGITVNSYLAGNRDRGFEGENLKHVSLNDAYLNVNANVNSWAKAFMSLSYSSASGPSRLGQYSAVYPRNTLNLEQGYLLFGDFTQSPFFFEAGKQFINFGEYKIHPIIRPVTQVMTEALQVAATAGFITQMGFHGSIYAFDNNLSKQRIFRHDNDDFDRGFFRHHSGVYGAQLAFTHIDDCFGYDLGVGYLSNIIGVNDVAYAVSHNPFLNTFDDLGSFRGSVPGATAFANVNASGFGLGVRYVTATKHFNRFDLPKASIFDFRFEDFFEEKGARPWAADAMASYSFNAWCAQQSIVAGYGWTGQAVNLFLPRHRYTLGYTIDPCMNTTLGIMLAHDTAYSRSHRDNDDVVVVDRRDRERERDKNRFFKTGNSAQVFVAVKFG